MRESLKPVVSHSIGFDVDTTHDTPRVYLKAGFPLEEWCTEGRKHGLVRVREKIG